MTMTRLLVSSRKGLIVYIKQHDSFVFESLHFRGIPISLAYFDPVNQMLWAFQDHGHWGMKVQRSKDFGRHWDEVAAPVYPDGEEVKNGIPAALKYIWAVQQGGTDNPGVLWLGTEPGGLFKSEDGGNTFQLNEPLWNHPSRKDHWQGGGRDHPGIHSIVLDPNDHNHLYIGISCAGVFETLDGGQSWAVRNNGLRADFLPDPVAEVGHDPHLLVCCPNDPRHLWQQNHCGIFKSSDGGASWIEVSEENGPAKFGFTIAVDEKDPEKAWVVPAVSDEIRVAVDESLCVSRTEDGGKTWQHLRKGLPQHQSFDIVYRHALAKKEEDLVFGTTTGNLFHSIDGGDHWNTLSNFLPMVYAVSIVSTD
jgi:photosystem II stability/assembly factor-like uncharacterized protein